MFLKGGAPKMPNGPFVAVSLRDLDRVGNNNIMPHTEQLLLLLLLFFFFFLLKFSADLGPVRLRRKGRNLFVTMR